MFFQECGHQLNSDVFYKKNTFSIIWRTYVYYNIKDEIIMDLYDNFIELLSALEKEEVDYCLIGGFAIVLYGSKRTTQDLDIFIRDTEENISKLQIALASLYNDESIKEITKNELIEYSVIRYGTTKDFSVDFIAHLGTAFSIDDIVIQEIF